jgi:hypothetical protein
VERVAFVDDESGGRIDCLLNPESLEVTRTAGVRARGAHTGRLTGAGLADDPVHLTGGGRTELVLDLLFDTELDPLPGAPIDVRAITRRLWQLAENSADERGAVRPPLVRFVWGKTWNVPGLVVAVAERFDRFDAGGTPRRSWLRLRFVRVAESAAEAEAEYEAMVSEAEAALIADADQPLPSGTGDDQARALVVAGEGSGTTGAASRPGVVRFDLLAADGLGNPLLWRRLAAHNDIADPLHVPAGAVLTVPNAVSGASPR